MRKINVVISCCGEYEDYRETIERGFTDKRRAEAFMQTLREDEEYWQSRANKCKECGGTDKTCPFYIEAFHTDVGCENYEPCHDEVEYRIDEIELEDEPWKEE